MGGPRFSRRGFIQAGTVLTLGSTAGCIESRSPFAPPVVSNRPDTVYIPSHFEGMKMVGTGSSGPLDAAVTFSYPHRFWLLSGTDRSRVRIRPEDSLHLMVHIWDRDSGVTLSGAAPRVRVESDTGTHGERIFWPMLSQRMGVHYGDNLTLPADGTYTITVDVPPTSDWRSPRFEGRLDDHQRFEFDFSWSQSALDSLAINMVSDDRKGSRGALPPMEMGGLPLSIGADTLPGEPVGTATSDGMQILASVDRSDASPPDLLVTATTPHNGYSIPMLGPVAAVGGTRYRLRSALDPAIGMHYRTELPALDGSESIRLDFPTPPQVVRHEGYETAFNQPEPVAFSLP